MRSDFDDVYPLGQITMGGPSNFDGAHEQGPQSNFDLKSGPMGPISMGVQF